MSDKEKYNYFDRLFEEKKIYIFGAGMRGKECLEILKRAGIKVEAFFDNNEQKYEQNVCGIKIIKPEKKENVIVVITVLNHYEELKKQLFKLGYDENEYVTYEQVEIANYKEKIKCYKEYENKQIVYEYPRTIQLPITYLCNFDCVMCGMHNMINRKDFTAEELGKILEDKLFAEVESVGVNGGEPFLKPDILDCFKIMIDTLPNLKVFNIISNGFFTDKILNVMSALKNICEKKDIYVNLSISIDGIDDMQDFHRGKCGAFANAEKTCKKILENRTKYVNNLNVICTITKYNIERINEVVVWSEEIGIEVDYNIATKNVRIENQSKVDSFLLLGREQARMLATEFFYYQYLKTRKEKYFALYLYLLEGKRYADCPCMHNEWITITPNSQIGFCATYSKELGSALEYSAYELVQNNLNYLQNLKKEFCATCSHYSYKLNSEGIQLQYENEMINRDWRI